MPINAQQDRLTRFQLFQDMLNLAENQLAKCQGAPIGDVDDSRWEFRISLLPEPENLKKAAKLLGPIFAAEDLEFEFLSLNGPDPSKWSWDATEAKLDDQGSSDRDQRGKECCVYVRFPVGSDIAEKTPTQLKALMLKAWRVLQKNNIQFGYVSPPTGDKAISVQGFFVSPFSYAANRPWLGPHAILFPEICKHEADGLLRNDPEKVERYKQPRRGLGLDLSKTKLNAQQQQQAKLIDNSSSPDHNPMALT